MTGVKSILFSFLFLLLFVPYFLTADSDVEFSGFADTIYAFQLKGSQDQLAARTRLRTEIEAYSGDSCFYASLDGEYNNLISSKTDITLKEAYYEYLGDNFDFRLGRQIIIWGKADGVQITDIVSPKDMTEFVGLEYDDTRLPIDGLKFRVLGNTVTFESIWIPVYTPSLLPSDPDNPLAVVLPEDTLVEEGDYPVSFSDSEWALRSSFYLSFMDFSVSVFRGWDDTAVSEMKSDSGTTTITPDYYKIWMAGFDAAIPAGAFVFRMEGAWIGDRYFTQEDPFQDPLKKNQLLALGGADWNPGGGWTITMQYSENLILDYDNAISRDEHKMAGTLSISKNLLRETLTLSAMGYIGLNYGDTYSSVEVEYDLTDQFQMAVGSDIFTEGKDGKGDYSSYTDLSCMWLRGRYSF